MALDPNPNPPTHHHQKLTFLIQTSEDHSSKVDKKEQTIRRHQHAATVAHRRIQAQRKRSLVSNQPQPQTKVANESSALQPRQSMSVSDGRQSIGQSQSEAVGRDQSASTCSSPRSDPSGGLFDPFDVLHVNVKLNGKGSCVGAVGQSQMVFRSGMSCNLPSVPVPSVRWFVLSKNGSVSMSMLISTTI
jgi:hypothetical protein